jgi:lactobin A/cerein 7B family class IIb bacteriocin
MEQFNHDGLYVLSLEEIETYNGGFVPAAVAAALGFAAGVLFAAAVTDWQDVREGWYDGINGYPPRHQTKPAGK